VPVVHETAPLVGIPSAESDHIGGTIGMLAVEALSALLAMLGAGAGAALVSGNAALVTGAEGAKSIADELCELVAT
jgi:hypothetical protein